MDHSDFDFQIKLAAEITTLAVQDCEGCTNSYESLSNHTCDVYPWWRKVLLYFGPALENLSIREDTKEKALKYILCEDTTRFKLKKFMEENGPSLFDK